MHELIDSGAVFNRSKKYRYNLWRTWDPSGKRAAFIMLNPSRADVSTNDPTIRSCISFAQALGFGSVEVVNLFAYRTPHPHELRQVADPIGCKNDEHIAATCGRADTIILAWGNYGSLLQRDAVVLNLLQSVKNKLQCFDITKLGQPRHPLYVKHTTPLRPFH